MVDRKCSIAKAAEILGRKWTLEMIYNLQEKRRFCELQNMVGDLNPATLTQRLKTLESSGIVNRTPVSEAPRHVEYELTEKGKELISVLSDLINWENRWYPEEKMET